MRIPRRPREVSTTLAHHAGLPDGERPVFVYRFPSAAEQLQSVFDAVSGVEAEPGVMARLAGITDVEERARELERLMGEGKVAVNTRRGAYICGLFDRQLVRIDHLEIEGDGPFDVIKHLPELPAEWKFEVGQEIEQRLKNYLTEIEAGNSSSPSHSEETGPMKATDAAAADSATSETQPT